MDKGFVRHLGTDSGDLAIVQSIMALAQAFGLDVVAEGVETGDRGQDPARVGMRSRTRFSALAAGRRHGDGGIARQALCANGLFDGRDLLRLRGAIRTGSARPSRNLPPRWQQSRTGPVERPSQAYHSFS